MPANVALQSDFMSAGVRCAAELLLPDSAERPPIVVMAHGFAAQKDFGLAAFAERFNRAGLAVLLFDYRGFGASDGRPRHVVDPEQQLADWRAALAHVRSNVAEVDASRLALWGTSFAGGHVLATAAEDPGVSAVVAQVPFVGGRAVRRLFDARTVLRVVAAGARDLARAARGREPYYVPAIGAPGTFAALNTPDALEGYGALVPPGSEWRNEVAARSLLKLGSYQPLRHAADIRAHTLVVAARNDALIPIGEVREAVTRIPGGELVELECEHFEPYVGSWFEKAVAIETAFLARCLLATAAEGGARERAAGIS